MDGQTDGRKGKNNMSPNPSRGRDNNMSPDPSRGGGGDIICKNNDHTFEPHDTSNNVVCVSSKASDQPAHARSLIRAFPSHLNIL